MNKLVIIGGGPAGYETAIKAKKVGLDVTLIEKNELGGVCLFEGCIPTKTLLQSAKLFATALDSAAFGVNMDNPTLDYQTVMLRKNGVIFRLNEGIKFKMEENKIEVIKGEATIIGPHQIQVNNQIIHADYIMIATGSSCRYLPIPGGNLNKVIHARELLSLTELPKSLTIIGSGVIGCEFACLFSLMGVKVTVLEMQNTILPLVDQEISKRLLVALKRSKIEVKTSVRVESIQEIDDQLRLTYLEKNQVKTVDSEYVLLAIGRKPNLDIDSLNNLSIAYNKQGIVVNDHYQTNLGHMYAIGDVNGRSLLAHSAIFQGEKALKHLIGQPSHIRFDLTPNVIFTHPEIAFVGAKESDLPNKDYKVYKSLFAANCKATILDESFGFAKVITDLDDVIIGAHMIGVQASILIAEMVVAMKNNMTLQAFKEVIHAHPTLSEIWQDLQITNKYT